jgi:hypothetical protein
MNYTYFNNERLITMYFHSDSGYWLILTTHATHRVKAGELDYLIKDGVLK